MKTVEEICQIADQNGIGKPFRAILASAVAHRLVARPHERAIRFAPPQDKRRYLLTIWAEPVGEQGELLFDVFPDAFAEFFPIALEDARALLGATGLYEVEQIHPDSVPEFIQALEKVFAIIRKSK